MGGISIWTILIIWLIPIIIIAKSSRATGGEKVAWLLATIFISWFSFVFYLLLAPISNKETHQK
ncbi:hypothetical protein L3081_09120 [Colwellia sp. MSW7]|jgi:hypothetical protein|uniref:Cardiolipin synthase N-terminal domain-containing protein n=1 Tax=Colwellia maritima TaxID=2912588 RepID=A0ABS9WZU9_9GAMM|nr:hypothetical protein [Colwellia maritima]MCI2283521.1 hypothetical protein [Colwellia maritima]